MTDDVRAAVERMRLGVLDPRHYAFPLQPRGQAQADAAVIVDAYLADHPADEDTPVDAGWLTGLPGAVPDGGTTLIPIPGTPNAYLAVERDRSAAVQSGSSFHRRGAAYVAVGGRVRTRGDVYALLRVLGCREERQHVPRAQERVGEEPGE
jgi:hypothetical protein